MWGAAGCWLLELEMFNPVGKYVHSRSRHSVSIRGPPSDFQIHCENVPSVAMFCFVFFQKFRLLLGLHLGCAVDAGSVHRPWEHVKKCFAKHHNWRYAPQCTKWWFSLWGVFWEIESYPSKISQILTIPTFPTLVITRSSHLTRSELGSARAALNRLTWAGKIFVGARNSFTELKKSLYPSYDVKMRSCLLLRVSFVSLWQRSYEHADYLVRCT